MAEFTKGHLATLMTANFLGLSGLSRAWAAVTGFGGAIVMWGTVIAALADGAKKITRQVSGSPL